MGKTLLRTSTAVVGQGSVLAQRVADRLEEASVAVRLIDVPETPELAREALDGVRSVVIVGRTGGEDLDGTGGSDLDLAGVRRLLDGASRAGVQSLVVLSSSMVYGAKEGNAVPLTEEAQIRPESALTYAVELAELERLTAGFRDGRERTVAVLRPAVVLGPSSTEWLRRSAWVGRQLPPDETIPPRQFVHVDDVVGAVLLATEQTLDGTFNVAPDGWIAGDTFRELAGARRLPLPERLGRVVSSVRRTLGGSRLTRGLEPYTQAPWVVANDRLRATGWTPTYTSEEVYVETDHARGLRGLSPRARQELSLGAAAAVVVGATVGILAFVRRRRRRS